MTPLNDLAERIYAFALERGLYAHQVQVVRDPVLGDVEGRVANPSIVFERLALVHSEVSEVLEEVRNDDAEAEALEVADVIIRMLDYAAWRGIDVDEAVALKMAKNEDRKHGLWRNRA